MPQLTLGMEHDGFKVIAAVQYPHPRDRSLYTVLCHRDEPNSTRVEWVVWSYNEQTGEFHSGSYFVYAVSAYEWFFELAQGRVDAYYGRLE